MKTSALGERLPRRESFRRVLQGELLRRCHDNPKYSLRAFARFLRIDHATLSQILRAKRRLTEATIRRLGARLALDAERIEEHVKLERASADTAASPIDVREARELTADTLEAIATWHDWAILELTRVKTFVPDARWIARVLDCSVDDVQLALHRLTRLGFLRMASRTKWVDCTEDVVQSAEDLARVALERLAGNLRELSLRVARGRTSERWSHSVTTLAVSAAAVPEAIARLEQLRAELVATLEREPSRDAVYHLAITFIPITARA